MTVAASASGIVQGAVPASRRPDGTLRKEIKVKPGFIPQEDIPRFRSPRVLEKLKGSASPAVPSPSPPAMTITSDAFSTASLVSSLDAINTSSSSSIDSPSAKRGSSASIYASPLDSSVPSASASPSTTGFKSGAAASMHAPLAKKTGSSASMHAPASQPPVSDPSPAPQDTSSPISLAPSVSTSVPIPASTTATFNSSSQGPTDHSGTQDQTDELLRSPPRKPWPARQVATQNDSAETKSENKPESSSAKTSGQMPELIISASTPSKLAMDQPPSTFASSQLEIPPATAYRSARILDGKSNQVDRSARHNIDSDWNAAKHCFLDEDDYEDKRSRKGGRKGKNTKKGKGSSKTPAGRGAEVLGIPIIQSDRLGSNATFVDGSELDEDLQKTFTPSPSLSRVLPPSLSKLDPSKAPFIFPSRPSTPIHSAGPSSPAAEERPNPVVNLPISAGLAEKKDKDREGHGAEGDLWRRRKTEEDSLFGASGKGPIDRIVVNLPKGKPGLGEDGVRGTGPASTKEGGAKEKKKKKKKKNAAKAKEDGPVGKGARGKREELKVTAEEQVKQKKEEQPQMERPTVLPSFSDDSWGVHLRTTSWADEIDLEEDEPNFG